MSDKSIESRIREHYVSESGEWLVEKGKVKEARLLKEACETIEWLRRQYESANRSYYRELTGNNKAKQDLDAREKAIAERELRFEERKASFIKHMGNWV